MTVPMTVQERIAFPSLLPKEVNLVTGILVKDIAKKIEFTQDDLIKFNLRVEGKNFSWDSEKDIPVEIEFTDKEIELLSSQIKKLDSESKINIALVSVCLAIQGA